MTHAEQKQLDEKLKQFVNELYQQPALGGSARYYVAYSGGVDSCVLLHAMALLREQIGFELVALHVNHNLHAQSSQWSEHCAAVCESLAVPFRQTSLNLDNASELAARDARYNWFSQQLSRGDVLMTAHHQQDRVETLLFNLMRGAGSAGLSSLRSIRPFNGARLARPLLACSQQDVLDYAEQKKLNWIEDPSNQTVDYSRNFLRHNVLPVLNEFRSDAINNIARAAVNLEQENSVLREVAICDLVEVRELPKHPLDNSYALCFEDIEHLSNARQGNVLRFWLNSLRLHTPSKRLLSDLLDAIQSPPSSNAILQEQGCQFRFYKGYMYVMPAQQEASCFSTIDWSNVEQSIDLYENKIRVDATHKLRNLTHDYQDRRLRLTSRAKLNNPTALQGHSLNLKKWLQDIGIPPWRRQALPLLTLSRADDDLVIAPVDQQLQSDWVLLECPVS